MFKSFPVLEVTYYMFCRCPIMFSSDTLDFLELNLNPCPVGKNMNKFVQNETVVKKILRNCT